MERRALTVPASGSMCIEEGTSSVQRHRPERSPLSYPELMGPMLPRGNALEHPLLREAFTITERIMDCHPAVREYLSVT